jgi:hypothetical protein
MQSQLHSFGWGLRYFCMGSQLVLYGVSVSFVGGLS